MGGAESKLPLVQSAFPPEIPAIPDKPIDPDAPLVKRFPCREIQSDFQPTAAVVGAGLAGVHCAWELARLGFKVRVFERLHQPGEGATKYDSGLVYRASKALQSNAESDAEQHCISDDQVSGGSSGKSPFSPFAPVVWRLRAASAYLSGLSPFFSDARSPYIPSETPFGGPLRISWRTWASSRRKLNNRNSSAFQKQQFEQSLIDTANELAHNSYELVDAMLEADPKTFGDCIVSESGPSSSSSAASSSLSMASSSAPEESSSTSSAAVSPWRCIDTSEWCRRFSTLLSDAYGVNFFYGNYISRLDWRVNENFEFVSNVISTNQKTQKTTTVPVDLVVVAAGSLSIFQREMHEGYELPLIAASGYGLDIPVATLSDAVKDSTMNELLKLDADSSSDSSCSSLLAKFMPYHLSEKHMLRVGPTPPSADCKAPGEHLFSGSKQQQKQQEREQNKADGEGVGGQRTAPEPKRVRISGLFSLRGDDVRQGICPPEVAAHHLASRVLTLSQFRQDLDLRTKKILNDGMSYDEFIDRLQNNKHGETTTGFRYSRGLTSDGLPIVSRLGNARNVFICAGFGDDAALFAPGSAQWLSDVIMKKRSTSSKECVKPSSSSSSSLSPAYTIAEANRATKKSFVPEQLLPSNPLSLDRFYEYKNQMEFKNHISAAYKVTELEKAINQWGNRLLSTQLHRIWDLPFFQWVFSITTDDDKKY